MSETVYNEQMYRDQHRPRNPQEPSSRLHGATEPHSQRQFERSKIQEKYRSKEKPERNFKSLPPIINLILLLCIVNYLHLYYTQTKIQTSLLTENNRLLKSIIQDKQVTYKPSVNKPLLPAYQPPAAVQKRQEQSQTRRHISRQQQMDNRNTYVNKQQYRPSSELLEINNDYSSRNFQPYTLKKNMTIYSMKERPLITIEQALMVSLYTRKKKNKYFEIKFESWVISTYMGSVFSKRSQYQQNEMVTIVNTVNTRTEPNHFDDNNLLGKLSFGNQFAFISARKVNHYVWYKIIISGLVKAADLQ